MNVELMLEMRRYIEMCERGDLPTEKIDELLDCALECARLLTLKSISARWRELRPQLEEERGTPFIYVGVHTDDDVEWIAIPPMYAEVEAKNGYALSPIVPSSAMLISHLAQQITRAGLINNADKSHQLEILIIHALTPPVSFELTRADFINQCIEIACGAKMETLGNYAQAITCITRELVRDNAGSVAQ